MSWPDATTIAADVAAGRTSALSVTRAALAAITAGNPALNAFTAVTAERALARAAAIDADIAAGQPVGPLAGVPFAVKNLFDIEGLITRAGAALTATDPPAARDASLVRKLEAAGAVLVGALNMGEFAYDFTGENAHDGACHNPHDLARMSGGSSSGSAAAVAGGLVPIALCSDTNGSIRVPAALCGIFGLKPTYGRLSRAGSYPFVASLDHLGPVARSVRDLALAYDAMQGADADDPAQTPRPVEAVSGLIGRGGAGLRVAVAGGYFRTGASPECLAAVDAAARALGAVEMVEFPHVAHARASAYLITASEGASFHLERLRASPAGFDPDTRDRFLAGAMLPAAFVQRAQRMRRWFGEQCNDIFQRFDVVLFPATPCPAPLIGQKTIMLGAQEVPLRANLGVYTQPLSFVGLPVALAPVFTPGGLPVGVQIAARPWREDVVLRVAAALEAAGVAKAQPPG
jgi:aspartyl-tRNA(Asn)/glutamyl-tRNA(Gln) amidotransferase subunit A